MKRALAERAKQSLSSPTQDASVPPSKLRRVATEPVSSSSSSLSLQPLVLSNSLAQHVSEPPLASKSPRPDVNENSSGRAEATPANALPTPATTTSTTQSSNSKKRPDLSVPDDASNAFYLKHQNRALAVEWRDLNHQVQSLQQERDERRRHCSAAVEVLQSLQSTWTQLEQFVIRDGDNGSNGNRSDYAQVACSSVLSRTSSLAAPVISVPSTGTGDSLEWTMALSQALSQLGEVRQSPPSTLTGDALENCASGSGSEWSHKCAANIAARAAILREQIASFLQRRDPAAFSNASLLHDKQQIQELQSKVSSLTTQLAESMASRSHAVASERKLRRNFYKLQAGLLTKDQFMNELNMEPEEELGDWAQQQEMMVEQARRNHRSESSASQVDELKDSLRGDSGSAATSEQVKALLGQIKDLEQKISNRDDSIQSLSKQLIEKEQRINALSATQQSDDARRKLETLAGAALQLQTAETTVASLETKLQETRENWASALGNAQTVEHAMDEQQQKFAKKWEELSAAFLDTEQQPAEQSASPISSPEPISDMPVTLLHNHAEAQSRQIIQLQHKLTQAIENVRQAESTREDLKDALELNESLQSKLEELKGRLEIAKNGDKVADEAPSDGTASRPDEGFNSTLEAAGQDSGGSGAMSAEKFEKIQRENRRMRKDMAAFVASKDAAKAKLERAEKERDSLLEMNARLLKQMTEKDEMNAKSLSTILHLKSMTEQLVAERDNLEQQAKSASQLALAARLAANAKDRVSEEATKEKTVLEAKLRSLEEKLAASASELARMTNDWAEASGKMASVNSELTNALKRSDELVLEIEKKNSEIRDLVDLLKKAERKANEASEKHGLGNDTSSGGASAVSNFSVEQLNTQIGVLKSKLACPVCHYRDKECIILRCRHLHCKQCVEERITSRNRKCPTCNNKFTEKDVADIWLNT